MSEPTEPLASLRNNPFEGVTVIHTYTRKEAIEDGVLVDLTAWASDGPEGMIGGFKIPVAATASVWADLNAIPESQSHQSVRGRAHDLLWMASLKVRRLLQSGSDMDRVLFQLHMRCKGDRKSLRTYKIICGPGDDMRPCLTIMQTHED